MEIPHLRWDDPKVAAYFINSRPIVLTDCPLASPAAHRWTGDYLNSIISKKFRNNVFVSDSLNFQYWDDSKNNGYNYKGKMSKVEMSFPDFITHLRQSATTINNNNNSNVSNSSKSNNGNKKYYYLQQSVVVDMGQAMMDEYKKFSLEAALKFKVAGNWDGFSTNLLLVGPAGAITPCHFDEQENLFSQLYGQKRVRLLPPEAWKRLYPYPLNHACDRQARFTLPMNSRQKHLDDPIQNNRYPAFEKYSNDSSISEYNTVLNAGEILYIPQFWFHQMEALTENTSLSWWFKHQSRTHNTQSGVLDLSLVSYVAVRRNLERMIGQSVGEGRQAHNLFLAMAAGKLIIPMTDGKKITAPGSDDDYPGVSGDSGANGKTNTITNRNVTAAGVTVDTAAAESSTSRSNKNIPTASGGDDDDDDEGNNNIATSNNIDVEKKTQSMNNNNNSNNNHNNNHHKNYNNISTKAVSKVIGSSSSSSSCSLSSSSPSAISASSASSVQAFTLIKSGYTADYSQFHEFLSADVSDFEKQQIQLPMDSDKLVSHAIEVASYVLGPSDAPAFLKELVSGRFSEL